MAEKTAIEWTDAQKKAARYAVNLEVKRGNMPHANDIPCLDCGHIHDGNGNRHEYDHPRGYDYKHHLDVEPVCKRCHVKRDNQKAAQTACARGHAFTVENTKYRANGTRECRQCRRDRERVVRSAEWWKARRERKAAHG
jgi:hypothetical protein